MTQLFGYSVIEKETDSLDVDLVVFGSLDNYIIYRVDDKNYHGNIEIYIDKIKMWMIDETTNRHFYFDTVDIEMARYLRKKFDNDDAQRDVI